MYWNIPCNKRNFPHGPLGEKKKRGLYKEILEIFDEIKTHKKYYLKRTQADRDYP